MGFKILPDMWKISNLNTRNQLDSQVILAGSIPDEFLNTWIRNI